MKAVLLGLACLLTSVAVAQQPQPMNLAIAGTPGNHQISWRTTPNFNYLVQTSLDLRTWIDIGIAETGNGSTVTYGFANPGSNTLYYRVRAFSDSYNGGFLTLPANNDDYMLVEGVRFGFNLNILPNLPSKIRIYVRSWNTGAEWNQIGLLTDFASSGSNRFLRGSAVWLPDAPGEYEIQATAINATGGIVASTVRHVTVEPDQLPVVNLTYTGVVGVLGYGSNSFSTTFPNRNANEIRRVEFVSGSTVLGSDTAAPFGDLVRDWINQQHDFLGENTIHSVTAKAYDYRGLASNSSSPAQISTNSLNSSPTLTNVVLDKSIVTRGESFTITYNANNADTVSSLSSVYVLRMFHEHGVEGEQLAEDNSAPFTSISINTTNWEPGTHLLYVGAMDTAFAVSRPVYLTVYVRENAQEIFATNLATNIVDTTTATPTNALYTGIKASSSTFTGGVSRGLVPGMDQGSVLTTGLASNWNGGDDSEFTDETFDVNFQPRDRWEAGDLDVQMHQGLPATVDAAALQFEVYCNHGQLEVDYQYGSEEYGESSGTANDAFLMAITRPGAPASTPIAFLPDGQGVPNISTINMTQRRHLYRDDDSDILSSVAPVNQPNRVEYDGMTIKLRAHVFLSPGATYKIKFAICDGPRLYNGQPQVDHSRDSALFIGKSSVRTVQPTP